MSQLDAVYIRAQVGVQKMFICAGANRESPSTSHTQTDTHIHVVTLTLHQAGSVKWHN